ncbi:copper resistance protein CopZ [Methylobacterium sp. Leaf456]|nr:copper resistance protein CopZ [Methylobacterium sp. Leaf456]
MPHARPRAALPAALVVLPLLASAASAHAVLERKEASPNAAYRGVVQIMHGCDGRPTTRISVTIPEGVTGAKPMPKPGWTLATTRSAYAKPYPSFHGTVTEGVTTITWSGGSLPDDQVDEFTFLARVSDDFAPGATIYFPVEQDCSEGGYHWSEVPAQGQDTRALKSPAPAVRIVAAKAAAPAPVKAETEAKAAALAIETPWLRATPGGAKVAGGYVTVRNTGSEPDRLTGATLARAGRGEIHSMSTENGVMKMAPVEGGLPIAPGGTVALKPGGLHLMFLDLTDGLRAGETVSGTLTFERAGSVPVTFAVAPIGAQGPTQQGPGAAVPEAGSHAHHH